MKNKNLQSGFVPFLIIAIIAVLAVGGGVYVSKKNKEAKQAELEDNLETQANANANADANANANANLGINANLNAKGTLRSLLAYGKNTVCTFTTTKSGVTTAGTVWVSAEGDMRGDFKTTSTTAGTTNSSMIVKDDVSYAWSGSQGAKINVLKYKADANTSTKQSVDIDAEVDYDCSDWVLDTSKFTLPSGVNFVDVEALLKTSAGAGIKIPSSY